MTDLVVTEAHTADVIHCLRYLLRISQQNQKALRLEIVRLWDIIRCLENERRNDAT